MYDFRKVLSEEDLAGDDPIVWGYIDEISCMDHALVHLAGELGIKEILSTANVSVIIANENNGFLSLYTNHSLTRAPSAEAIEKLRVALGEEEGPKWCLDARFWYWKPRPASVIRAMRKSSTGVSKENHRSK